jgi:hypothetical protein
MSGGSGYEFSDGSAVAMRAPYASIHALAINIADHAAQRHQALGVLRGDLLRGIHTV